MFGLRPSPAVLGAVISLHIEKYHSEYPQIVDLIDQSLHVDDGGVTIQEALDVYKVAKHIMHQGGFNLRRWNSNSMGLLKLIQQHERKPVPTSNSDNEELKESSDLECDGNNICKLLGVDWNNLRDEFTYELSEFLQYVHSLLKTKRSVLKLTASLFDPLGLSSTQNNHRKLVGHLFKIGSLL